MATLLLSAAGAAVGSSFSGSILGLSGAVIGRAVGATIGRVIDQKLLGQGTDPVETGKIDRYKLSGVGEGTPVADLHGRMRLGGQVIWSTHFLESASTTGGGKGAPSQPKTTTYSYSVSLAFALCEGEISGLGRIWVDGNLIEKDTLSLRLYRGTEDQLPDPKMEAVEGAGEVPAYRGLAYVVVEDLDLSPYGNRVPQFSFEVVRASEPAEGLKPSAGDGLRGVALIPGTGEYALATTPVSFQRGLGQTEWVNLNSSSGATDFVTAMDALTDELPNCGAVSLVVTWFGSDLRASQCQLRPKVEQKLEDAAQSPWSVSGLNRSSAEELSQVDERPVYGGTPSDQSVIEAIDDLNQRGLDVMYYPFILMDILAENGLPDPWSDGANQPVLPWRGRITGDKALGVAGSTDGTEANANAVASFFGSVTAGDFAISNGAVSYSGPLEWSYSRFILHQAALCAAAGGVSAFCIGSEMRGLTQMRDTAGFPAVDRLIALAAEVRALLPDAKLGYAADWSEYFGFHPQDGTGDVLYHLDPLWADETIDFVGIDNYMPLADWRDGADHADANWGSSYNLEYLQSNIEGGEGYDWYYASEEGRVSQNRLPITDGAGGTPWVYRFKDVRNWWSNLHFDRAHPLDRSVLDAGTEPASWTVAGVASIATYSAEFDRFKQPVELSSGGASADGLSAPTVPALSSDQSYELRLHLQLSGSNSARVDLNHPFGAVVVTLDPDLTTDVTDTMSVVQDHEAFTESDGVITLRVVLRFGAVGALDVLVSPNSATVGDSVIVFGGTLTDWPVSPTAWIPQSKPIWFTEIGFPAIDKGANQPNVFFDPKSSESAVPHFSNGRRDDVIQMQSLRAVTQYWGDPENNPISTIYDGPMIDTGRIFAWAWDTRPFPTFPNDIDRWSDGGNFRTGHWVSGRISGQSLDLVVAEICRRAGVTDVDVDHLYGVVRGYSVAETDTARARLQPLMLAYDFTAVERNGKIVFQHLPLLPDAQVSAGDAVFDDEADGLTFVRAPEAETVGRVRIAHVEADAAFDTRIAEAIFPDETEISTSQNDLPLSLTFSEARDIAERWLAASRLARDSMTVSLPPSRRDVVAGAMIELDDGTTWRVDQMEDRGSRAIEATRVEPSVSRPSDATEIVAPPVLYVPPSPVAPVFMDLPLLRGDEVDHAPHIAITAQPWPGSVAVYSSGSDSNFALNTLISGASVIGMLESELEAAEPGRWDRGPAVRVRVVGGALSSVSPEEVLNGANVAALGPDDSGPWEVIQFAQAELVAPDLWDISLRLRGQAGTDAVQPQSWPVGTYFVLMDGRPQQIELPVSLRGLDRNYRIGPARRSIDDVSYVARTLAFEGVGLRPYAPAHLRADSDGSDVSFNWIRRGRVDADSWQGTEIPLGEESEAYLIRVSDAGGFKREITVENPAWTYSQADRLADGTADNFTVDIAQISARFGPGPFTRIVTHV